MRGRSAGRLLYAILCHAGTQPRWEKPPAFSRRRSHNAGPLRVPRAAADARQAALAARHAAGAPELASGAATAAGEAALAARTAAGAVVLASGAAVAVGVTAAAARLVLEDNVRGCGIGHRWFQRKGIGCSGWCGGDRRSYCPCQHQWFREGQFR
jgi:hypothetical protein